MNPGASGNAPRVVRSPFVTTFDCLTLLTDYGLDDGFVAACHGVAAGSASPDPRASNLLAAAHRPDREQVRRAIIDGRPGMPAGLLGGHDVDLIAAYLSQDRH